MGEAQLDLTVKPQEYFREKVVEAMTSLKVEVPDDVEFYLVNLLCEFINPTRLETLTGELHALETPLALMYKQAVEAPASQRLKILKYLGDSSLYIAGFFQDFFNRKAFDIGYYISLGSSAYGSVSSIMRDEHRDEHFGAMYGDLAAKFTSLVDVVAEVSEVPGSERPVDILAIYDRWTRSNSERLARALAKVGIIPQPNPSRERQ